MVCGHFKNFELEILSKGIKETFRGHAWSNNCREWVYFECIFDSDSIMKRFNFDECIVIHEHCGTHDGQELGFYCNNCNDGIMGIHPNYAKNEPRYK